MSMLRTALPCLAILALVACASTPTGASMTVTPLPCSADYGCAGEVPDYSDAYGSAYAYYPVLVPVYPIVAQPAPPLPSPPPAPKIHIRAPVERPCPKADKPCP